ncbi:threonine ammonia-lyase [Spiroplasma endosymbiont of Polydrusus pterygomalis]|uniref:threonine ammonia-lyase n=1 Tax=Spiroplasma endosymbiont of Polydrusus pterygomalis TaxID=3139327 RepID=UPI003CCACFDF
MENLVSEEMIEEAYLKIKDKIGKTSLIRADKLSSFSNNNIFLKLENLQKTGSFKIRGALNKILNLSREQQIKGLIAASAGNHAQGVALAAKSLNLVSKIVMPVTAPLAKIAATKEFGGAKCTVKLYGNMFDDAMTEALRLEKEEGLTLVHPYDDNFVIAGQGTIGLEIYEQMKFLDKEIDYCLVPIGGGGLLSGIATYLKSKKPNIKFIGIESQNVDSYNQALQKGKPFKIEGKSSIADGIAVKKTGKLTFNILKQNVDKVVTVSEEEIAQAMLFLLEKCKVVTEGSGAVTVAAILSGKLDEIIGKNKNIVCVISDGNVDITTLGTIINSALISSHRRVPFSVNGIINNNTISEIINIITKNGASIYKIHSTFDRNKLDISNFSIFIVMDTSDVDQQNKIFAEIRASSSNFTLVSK